MAVDMHLKFKGGDVTIEGASNHEKHKKEIPILAWSWGVSNSNSMHEGSGSAMGGKANVQDISVTKYVDGSSNAMMKSCCVGSRADEAWLYVTTSADDPTDYITLHLTKGVVITSISTGGSAGEERLTENVSINFGAFKFSFQEFNDKGKKEGGTKDFAFDITTNKAT